MEFYNPDCPTFIPTRKAGILKSRRDTFATTIPKVTSIVPAPNLYQTEVIWEKQSHLKHSRIVKGAKNSFIDQILRTNKSPERSTPSPQAYDNLKSFKNTIARVHGGEQLNELRTSFVIELESLANNTPGYIYEKPPLVSTLNLIWCRKNSKSKDLLSL